MKRPIRALFISHDSGLYGAQRSLLGLLRHLDRDVVDSRVVAPAGGALVEAVEALGLPVAVRPLTRWVVSTNGIAVSRLESYRAALTGLTARVAALRALIDRHAIDLVYTNSVVCIDGALAARAARRPHVWHLREHVARNSDLQPLLPHAITVRVVAALSDHILTNSAALRAAYAAIASPGGISTVHNGIDLEEFEPPRAGTSLRQELGVRDDAKLVALIGSITPRKGHALFTQAAERIRRSRPDTLFLVVGTGEKPFVDALRRSVSARGLDRCVRFLGYRSDIAHILRATDVLVVASDQEAFGRTAIEAMASGVPVVATRCGGPEESVVHGETGLLVPLGDPDAMAEAVASIIADRAYAERLGRAGRRRAEQAFDVHTYAQAIQAVVERVAHARRD